ncbi:4736_t:CDS:2, partial [Entrophospora sp. SA101]
SDMPQRPESMIFQDPFSLQETSATHDREKFRENEKLRAEAEQFLNVKPKLQGYEISLPFHIIFRSGGLIVSMILGWALVGKRFVLIQSIPLLTTAADLMKLSSYHRYALTQIVAVIMITFGVVFATLSSANNQLVEDKNSGFTADYIFGIMILTVALVLSCFMGLYQEMNRSNDWREGLFYTVGEIILFQALLLNESPHVSLEE